MLPRSTDFIWCVDDCPACGAELHPNERECVVCGWAPTFDGREKGDDDGREYGHPGDRLKGWE